MTADRAAAARQALNELVLGLKASGVEVSAGAEPIGIDGKVVIRTRSAGVLETAAALEGLGYVAQHSLSPGGRRALSHAGRDLVFLPVDEARVTRVVLQWPGPGRGGPFARVITPAMPDLRWFPLPAPLWWAYWLIRPVRVVADRVSGQGSRINSPYLSTPTAMIRPLLELVKPEPGDRVVDLGCGDGRVLVEATRLYDCTGLGVESDPRLAARARTAVAEAGLGGRVDIEEGDLTTATLRPGDIVFLFLPTAHVARLLPGVLRRVSPGGQVLAHEQAQADWPTPPDLTHLLLDPSGVTVAHVWSGLPTMTDG